MSPSRQHGPRLFARDDLRLRPTGEARLRDMVHRPRRPATPRQLRLDEDHRAIERLRRLGAELAERFGLRFVSIEAESDGVVEHYGVCYADGVIRVRLRHAVTGRLLKESSLVDTLCHELAHLRHFDHSVRFRRFYEKILGEARCLGYYRPGPDRARPTQLPLWNAERSG